MYYFNYGAAENCLVIPRDYTLLPNKDSFLLFLLSVFTFCIPEPKSSVINVGPVGFEY
jgi:hypothetical protein